jgi:hypothetical protein
MLSNPGGNMVSIRSFGYAEIGTGKLVGFAERKSFPRIGN